MLNARPGLVDLIESGTLGIELAYKYSGCWKCHMEPGAEFHQLPKQFS